MKNPHVFKHGDGAFFGAGPGEQPLQVWRPCWDKIRGRRGLESPLPTATVSIPFGERGGEPRTRRRGIPEGDIHRSRGFRAQRDTHGTRAPPCRRGIPEGDIHRSRGFRAQRDTHGTRVPPPSAHPEGMPHPRRGGSRSLTRSGTQAQVRPAMVSYWMRSPRAVVSACLPQRWWKSQVAGN